MFSAHLACQPAGERYKRLYSKNLGQYAALTNTVRYSEMVDYNRLELAERSEVVVGTYPTIGHATPSIGWLSAIGARVAITSMLFYSAHAWSFTGWQNQVTLLIFTGWTAGIAVLCRRTPLEFIAPRFDGLVLRIFPRTAAVTPAATAPVTSPTGPANHVSTES